MTERNPFEYGRELGREELVDREEELQEIASTIRNRGKLFLIGPRRFGKTSLLCAAHEAAAARGAIVIRLDAEKYETLDLLAGALLATATGSLSGGVKRAMETVRKVAGHLRPQISFDGESFHVTLGYRRSEGGPLPLLTDALDAVEALAAQGKGEVAVILDEVQQIVVEEGLTAERQLRSAVQRHRHVAYVFAGSSTRLLTDMTEGPDRPFYRLGSRLFLGALPREDFHRFLVGGFRDTGLRLAEDAASRILDLAEEVPYNVQRLAHATWEMTRSQKEPHARVETVAASLQRIVLREDPAYTQLWTNLTTNQKKALKAVIQSRGREVLSAEHTQRLRIPVSSLRTALLALEQAQVVRMEASLGESRYRLVDPFLAEWIAVSQVG
jgi:hypothetical protein